MKLVRPLLSSLIALPLFFACTSKPPETVESESAVMEDDGDDPGSELEMMQECGGINETKINRAVERVQDQLSGCLMRGYEDVPFLGGDVKFLLQVNQKGKAEAIYVEESTLGSRSVEECMVDALSRQRWPKPVGGLIGAAHTGIGFSPPDDVRAPIDWDQSDIQTFLDNQQELFRGCGEAGGPFNFTAYIDRNGHVLSVGLAHKDQGATETASCLLNLIEETQFPSPGSYPAKVDFRLGGSAITPLVCE